MSTLRVQNAHFTVERREDALERLLLVACSLLPHDLADVGDDDEVARAVQVCAESSFWLDFVPRGAKVAQSERETRLGAAEVDARRKAFKLVGDVLVPLTKEDKA